LEIEDSNIAKFFEIGIIELAKQYKRVANIGLCCTP